MCVRVGDGGHRAGGGRGLREAGGCWERREAGGEREGGVFQNDMHTFRDPLPTQKNYDVSQGSLREPRGLERLVVDILVLARWWARAEMAGRNGGGGRQIGAKKNSNERKQQHQ